MDVFWNYLWGQEKERKKGGEEREGDEGNGSSIILEVEMGVCRGVESVGMDRIFYFMLIFVVIKVCQFYLSFC